MNDITFFQPHSRVHCTNSRNPYTSRKDGFTTVGFFFDLGKTAFEKYPSSSKIDKIKYKLIQQEDNDNEGKGFKLQPQSFPI